MDKKNTNKIGLRGPNEICRDNSNPKYAQYNHSNMAAFIELTE